MPVDGLAGRGSQARVSALKPQSDVRVEQHPHSPFDLAAALGIGLDIERRRDWIHPFAKANRSRMPAEQRARAGVLLKPAPDGQSNSFRFVAAGDCVGCPLDVRDHIGAVDRDDARPTLGRRAQPFDITLFRRSSGYSVARRPAEPDRALFHWVLFIMSLLI